MIQFPSISVPGNRLAQIQDRARDSCHRSQPDGIKIPGDLRVANADELSVGGRIALKSGQAFRVQSGQRVALRQSRFSAERALDSPVDARLNSLSATLQNIFGEDASGLDVNRIV